MRVFLIAAVAAIGLSAGASSINELMRDIGDTMLRMLPALHEEAPDRTVLLENLVRLDYLFDEAEAHLTSRPVASQVTYDLIQRRLDEALEVGQRRNIDLLRRSIAETFELCGSCHSQDGVSRPAFGVSKIRELDEYLAADFSYLTRDYGSALTSIDNYFESDERTLSRDQVMLERVLSIGGEIYADPSFTAGALRNLLPDVSGRTKERVDAWIHVMERLDDEDSALQSPLTRSSTIALDEFLGNEYFAISSTLSVDEQEAYWVVIRGALSRLLAQDPTSKEVPRLLYWLAVSDRALQYRYYNALSTAYLERCIESYPSHPYAKSCLEEYEFLVLINFSGSGGTRVPLDVQDRINELRAAITGG